MQSNHSDKSDFQKANMVADVLFFAVCNGFAMTTQVFLRDRFGHRYLNWIRLVCACIVFCVMAGVKDGVVDMQIFGFFFLVMWFCQYAEGRKRWFKMELEHGDYDGRTLIGRITRIPEGHVKRWVEPLVLIVGGAVGINLSPSAGLTVMLSGVGSWLLIMQHDDIRRQDASALYDAEIMADEMFEWHSKIKRR